MIATRPSDLDVVERDRLLSIRDAAERLSLAEITVRRIVAAGELRSVTIGRRRLIPAAALAAYLRARGA